MNATTTLPALERAHCEAPEGRHGAVWVPADPDTTQHGPVPCPYCVTTAREVEHDRDRRRHRAALGRLQRRYDHLLACGVELPSAPARSTPGHGPDHGTRGLRTRLVFQLREAVARWITEPGVDVVTGSVTEPGVMDAGELLAWGRTPRGSVLIVRQSDLPDLIGIKPAN